MNKFRWAVGAALAGAAIFSVGIAVVAADPAPAPTMKDLQIIAVPWKTALDGHPGLTPENARVRDQDGKILLSQPVDNDGDGAIDELLFVADLAGTESVGYAILADASLPMPAPAVRAFARYVPERKDDFAWENDLVAFRAYGPALREGVENCGIDCFMKRVKYPIIDNWYAGEAKLKSYHVDYGEGYDGYKVGASLGCGGSAVWRDGRMYRSEVFTGWRRFANGPIRAVFELSYGPWEVAGQQVTEKKIIALDIGKRLFRVDDRFFVDGKPARLEVVIGVTTHEGKAKAYVNRAKGYLYAWETIDGAGLGTAVTVPPQYIKDYRLVETDRQDEAHALFVVATDADGRFTYYAGYGWEKAGEITTREQWQDYLDRFVETTGTVFPVK